jgi:hypothetical protein
MEHFESIAYSTGLDGQLALDVQGSCCSPYFICCSSRDAMHVSNSVSNGTARTTTTRVQSILIPTYREIMIWLCLWNI